MRWPLRKTCSYQYIGWDVAFLVLLTCALGLVGGVPLYHPDLLVPRVLRTIRSGGVPQFFTYPGLVIYIQALVYLLVFGLLYVGGIVRSPVEFGAFYYSRMLPGGVSFYLPGLLVTIAFSVLGVLCTYFLTLKILRKRMFSWMAALFLATSMLWVTESHFITVDIPLAALSVLTVCITVVYTEKRGSLGLKHLLILGMLIGLTTSAKYTGAFVAIAVIGASLASYLNRKQWIVHMLFTGGIALLTFFITNPCILMKSTRFYRDLTYHVKHGTQGHFGFETNQGWVSHFQQTLTNGIGLPIVFLAVLGCLWLLLRREYSLSTKLATTLFPVGFYCVIASSTLTFQRYMVPVFPFIALYAALGAYALFIMIRRVFAMRYERVSRFLVWGIVILLIFPNILAAWHHNWLLVQPDMRDELQTIFRKIQLNSPPPMIFVGEYTKNFFPKSQRVFWNQIGETPVDLLLFDGFSHDRYIYDQRENALKIRTQVLDKLAQSRIKNDVLVQMSPFTHPKSQVPFSPKSLYSPYPPDLKFRRKAGPFLELYCKEPGMAQKIFASCRQVKNMSCRYLPAQNGYYYQKLFQ